MLQTTLYLVSIITLGAVTCLLRVAIRWFSYRTVVLILVKKVTSNLPKFPQEKFGQAQQQILSL